MANLDPDTAYRLLTTDTNSLEREITLINRQSMNLLVVDAHDSVRDCGVLYRGIKVQQAKGAGLVITEEGTGHDLVCVHVGEF